MKEAESVVNLYGMYSGNIAELLFEIFLSATFLALLVFAGYFLFLIFLKSTSEEEHFDTHQNRQNDTHEDVFD